MERDNLIEERTYRERWLEVRTDLKAAARAAEIAWRRVDELNERLEEADRDKRSIRQLAWFWGILSIVLGFVAALAIALRR